MNTNATTWVSAAAIAARFNVSVADVVSTAKHIGVHESRVHAKWVGGSMSLSVAAAGLVERELRSRGRELAAKKGRTR